MPSTRAATYEEAVLVANNLREADRQEVMAATGLPPELTMPQAVLAHPHTWAMVDDNDKPFALYGVCPLPGYEKFGEVWMLSTPELLKYKKTFLDRSKAELERLHTICPALGNCVDARNTVHIRWLKWMGFTFIREIPDYGVEKRPFYEFIKHRKSDV